MEARTDARFGRFTSFSAMLFALLLLLLVVASASSVQAQTVNWGPSATSIGFGAPSHSPASASPHPGAISFPHSGAVAPSVTSLGFAQIGHPAPLNGPHFGFGSAPIHGGSFHHRHQPFISNWAVGYGYPVYLDSEEQYSAGPPPDAGPAEDYRGGPTIFDRRGDGQLGHPEPVAEAPAENPPAPATEVASLTPTVLVFKDGHQSEVDNYAIVGGTLYDLTGGRRHKIALADLDLKATAEQNDDRGVDFQLPGKSNVN